MRYTILAICALWCTLLLHAQSVPGRAESKVLWRVDIETMVQKMSARGTIKDLRGTVPRGQKDFRKLYPRRKFDAEIADLEGHLGTWSDDRIALELARILAGAHVAHNMVLFPSAFGFEWQLPVAFEWYSDGLLITNATPAYHHLIGARVAAIGSFTPEKLGSAVAPYISHENSGWLRVQAADFVTERPVMSMLGLIDPEERVTMTVVPPGASSPGVVCLPFVQNPDFSLSLYQALRIPTPLRRMHWDKDYWYQFLEDSHTGYIQYRACRNDPKMTFADFARATLADLDRHSVNRIVIDLRENDGGNSTLIRPLVEGLKAHPQWNGHIYALIGARTFSSGLLNAIELKLDAGATLIGEPTGGKPGSYGEVEQISLPKSRLMVLYTLKYFRAPKGFDRDALYPDVFAAFTSEDILAGRDPALAAIAGK